MLPNNTIRKFEGIAKTNTTHTMYIMRIRKRAFEGIAKTNTTHTLLFQKMIKVRFEGIAKTNTTHTDYFIWCRGCSLRVLLKQILPTRVCIYNFSRLV